MSGSDELAEVQSRLDLSRNPWRAGDGVLEYHPDFEALGQLLSVPVLAGATTQSGRAAKAVDAWVAYEFRRAGFDPDAVWPRAAAPSVLPRDIRDLLIALPSQVEKEVARRLPEMRSIAPRDGRFLGRAYVKQVDVSMSHWSTGPELLISTKMMTASFGKNLSNRFEEAGLTPV